MNESHSSHFTIKNTVCTEALAWGRTQIRTKSGWAPGGLFLAPCCLTSTTHSHKTANKHRFQILNEHDVLDCSAQGVLTQSFMFPQSSLF